VCSRIRVAGRNPHVKYTFKPFAAVIIFIKQFLGNFLQY
jgi:hypothetical protein